MTVLCMSVGCGEFKYNLLLRAKVLAIVQLWR
jgi:hypothetical protein